MIELKGIYKNYQNQKVLKNINLKFDRGGIYCIIGESGCGKTTMMELINRLIKPSSGTIMVAGQDISKIDPVKLRRSIGYVVQKVGLFPHMTVGTNIEAILELQKVKKEIRKEKALELLNLVHLEESDYDKYPAELSGGQQQRVGIARGLSTDPEILLMDEPFSALDPITRGSLQDELIDLQKELGKTIIFVTHDMDEAIKIADKIAIMKDGNLLQFDSPEEILKNPANSFVEYFIGKDRLWKTPELFLVEDIMRKRVPTVSPRMNLSKAFEKMKDFDKDFVFVVDKGQLVGKVSKELLFKQDPSPTIVMKDIMVEQLLSLAKKDNLLDALTKVEESQNKVVPVIEKGNILVGMVTPTSLLNVIYKIKPEGGEDNVY
ncbi:MAG: betaine/proline/choline family ABC transporter ATP-binding protein [Psychrilyobacter sp.]|uniref:betaine/proline/choline family ABC transporter ATP-binding protein n=1 Tax=Psychrilyobacter sp. TaxID=2586924 RepID=UPI003C796567